VLSERIEWHSEGNSAPFVLSLAEFFTEALA
jgi:hypothetical protein